MNDFFSVGRMGPAECKTRPLGVPLHAQDGFCLVFEGFDDAVGGALGDHKSRTDPAAPLVVGAVDRAGIAVEAAEDGAGGIGHLMELVAAGIFVGGSGGEILDDISAKIDVDDLQAPADAKHRFFVQDESMEKIELGLIQDGIDGGGAPILLAKAAGMDVPSAGKQQAVTEAGFLRTEADSERNAKGGQGRFVIFGVPGDTCNENTHMMIRANRNGLLKDIL